MPDYRNIKKPTALIAKSLTKEQQAVVDNGGNEAAIGTDIADVNLDLWYVDDKTLVRSARDGKTVKAWSFKGYISPHDCREWYLATVPAKADPAT